MLRKLRITKTFMPNPKTYFASAHAVAASGHAFAASRLAFASPEPLAHSAAAAAHSHAAAAHADDPIRDDVYDIARRDSGQGVTYPGNDLTQLDLLFADQAGLNGLLIDLNNFLRDIGGKRRIQSKEIKMTMTMSGLVTLVKSKIH